MNNTFNKLSNFKIEILFIIIYLLFSFYLILNHNALFFQQDEYNHFFLLNNQTFFDYLFRLNGPHYSPLTMGLKFIFYKTFGLNVLFYTISSLFIYFFSLLSVYFLLKKINFQIGKIIIFLFTIIFLFANPLNSQAFLWLSTYDNTLPCITFSVLAIIFFLKFREDNNKKNLYISLLFTIISLLFKEYSIILFPFFLIIIFYDNNFSLKSIKKYYSSLTLIFIVFIIFSIVRFSMQLVFGDQEDIAFVSNRFSIINLIDSFISYFNIFIKSFWQILIPYGAYESFFSTVLKNNDTGYLFILINKVQFILGFIFWILIYFVIYIKQLFNDKKVFVYFLFYLLSIVPFTLITDSFSPDYLEGKYYFFISIALLLFIFSIISNFKLKIFSKTLLSIFFLFFISLNFFYFDKKIQEQSNTSEIRINIVNQIVNDVKKINTKNNLIIYVYGDNDGYYGIPDLQLPFQTGLGNILALHLYDNNVFIDTNYFKNKNNLYDLSYLYLQNNNGNLLSGGSINTGLFLMNTNGMGQGVYSFGNKKFGYFYNYDDLMNYLMSNENEINNVISFYWDKKANKLLTTTNTIRDKINYENKKYELNSSTNIEKDIKIVTNNKLNYSVNSKKGVNSYKDEFKKDIVIYKDDLEFSYGGAYLTKDLIGNDSGNYVIERNDNGYFLDFISSVKINNSTIDFDQKIQDNKILLELKNKASNNDIITITFGLKSRVFIYNENSNKKYYIESGFIEIHGNDTNKYSVNLKNELKSIRSVWINDNERYVPFGFSNNGVFRIKNYSLIENKIILNFEKNINKDEKILVPVIYYKDINNLNEKIYFNYK